MYKLKPSFYNNFKCIADKCTYNCCRDWAIYIDDAIYDKYKSYGEWCSSCVDISGEKMNIRLKSDCLCSFQSDRGLCKLVEMFGDEALSEACKTFPRNYSVYDGCIEYGLSNGCPEIIRILAEHNETVFIYDEVISAPEELPNTVNPVFDPKLISLRDLAIELIQIQDVDFVDRFLLLFQMAIDSVTLDADTIIKQYSDVDNIVHFFATIRTSTPEQKSFAVPMLRLLSETVNSGLKHTYGYKNIIKSLDDVASQYTDGELYDRLAGERELSIDYDHFYENICVNYLYTNGALNMGEHPFYYNIAILLLELGLIRYYDMLAALNVDNDDISYKESDLYNITSYYARCFENIGDESYTMLKVLEAGKTLPFSMGFAFLK